MRSWDRELVEFCLTWFAFKCLYHQCEICRSLYGLSGDQSERLSRGKSGKLKSKKQEEQRPSERDANGLADSRASDLNALTLLADPRPDDVTDSARTI